jgi:hypothetical protein
MTDSEILEFYNKLVEYYGDKLPSFEHEPKRFAFYVKMYKHVKRLK